MMERCENINDIFNSSMGPNEVINAIEFEYLNCRFDSALNLCQKWLQLNQSIQKPFKDWEVLVIAARCCLKLEKPQEALIYVDKIHVCTYHFAHNHFNFSLIVN